MLSTWVLTVPSPMNSRAPISRFVLPAAIQRSTSVSRGLSAGPPAAPSARRGAGRGAARTVRLAGGDPAQHLGLARAERRAAGGPLGEARGGRGGDVHGAGVDA